MNGHFAKIIMAAEINLQVKLAMNGVDDTDSPENLTILYVISRPSNKYKVYV